MEKMPAGNKRSYAIGGSVIRQIQFSLAWIVTGDVPPDYYEDVFWVSAKIIDRFREKNNIKDK